MLLNTGLSSPTMPSVSAAVACWSSTSSSSSRSSALIAVPEEKKRPAAAASRLTMALHFSKEKPDDQLLSDLATAAKFNDEMFTDFLAVIFSFLTQPKQASRMLSDIEGFAEQHGIKPTALKGVVRSYMSFVSQAQRNNLTPQLVYDDLLTIGLGEEKAEILKRAYQANFVALSRSTAGRTLSVNQLLDMEWRFGVTAGSSEFRASGATFLQLKMTLHKNGTPEDVYMELTLPQFYSFLQEMEKAKASLEYLG
eukprot:m.110192 g.110192  ORF g.110192 m.110192 type:complete len:253 (+) comp19179_c0_seq2:363-1121(+)